ncbi:MAG: aminotransferase class I/II-fold pyridoxal phosphate-dependent enzyme [Ruminococcaceae bacterium]|nr:aminotransferase class I/II-fold pyridoxal phosphate-dependent enzyme [Oscillospiraceae bacterium]
MEKLALLGGTPVLTEENGAMFSWPIMTEEDYDAAMYVVKNNKFSATDITEKFQEEFAAWQGRKYAIAYCNGTMSLTSAMFAIGLGHGDEIICPTKTYWGSVSQAINFGASAVFCNIDENLSMDPADIERCISPRTKAIMVVHYFAYPADMDPIMEIARKHNLYVIEDVSHAQGGMYKGKKLGTFGDIAAMSLMSGKSFAAGELGILVTDDTRLYERAMAFGHYERNNSNYIKESDDLKDYFHIALGGAKGRANQLCSALARVQLKYYDERCAEIRRAMNYFWDQLEGLPGIRAVRVDESTGSNMAGWYSPHGVYHAEELGGLSVKKFCEALRAEGYRGAWDGGNFCLHTHPFFKTFDLRNEGKPSRIVYNDTDVRLDDDKCAPSTDIQCFSVPWFKHFDRDIIDSYVRIFKKVIENHEQLLEKDEKQAQGGRWYGTENE